MDNLLKDKVVVVTGAVGLLGRVFCNAITRSGGVVVLADISRETGESFAKELNGKTDGKSAKFILSDITDVKSVKSLIDETVINFNKIDALVNNAYPRNQNYGRKFEQVEYEDFCDNVAMHLGGYFLTSQQFALFFQKQGHGNIVNISSVYGVIAPDFGVYEETDMTMPVEYAAIKSAVIHMTKYIAKYFKGSGIRSNCLSPGGIYANQPEEFIERYNQHTLSKGMLDRTDITGALLFLLSDMSAYMNGQNLIVDDGFVI